MICSDCRIFRFRSAMLRSIFLELGPVPGDVTVTVNHVTLPIRLERYHHLRQAGVAFDLQLRGPNLVPGEIVGDSWTKRVADLCRRRPDQSGRAARDRIRSP